VETDIFEKAETPLSSIWAGGLIGVSLIILQGFLSLSRLDQAAFISVLTLALAIPILAYKILADTLRVRKHNTISHLSHRHTHSLKTPYPELFLFSLGILLTIIGISAAFWHIHWIPALMFSVCTLLLLVITYFLHVRK
jgi:hypothetical protein